MEINKFKNDISQYLFNSKIEVDDKLQILLITDSSSIESIPFEMIHSYYIYKHHMSIYLKKPPHINIRTMLLKKAV